MKNDYGRLKVLLSPSKLLLIGVVTGFLSVACAPLLAAQAAAAQAAGPKKDWKDRAEYDLYDSLTKETNPAKKLELLNTWKSKYDVTDFKAERSTLFLTTYVALGKAQEAVNTAKEILADDPKNFTALYYITLFTPRLMPASADVLDQGEKASNGLIANLDTQFAADKKPATVSDADWAKAKSDTEVIAHTTLGWIAQQRKDNDKAEQEFLKSLAINPNSGEVSYWLGTVVLAEKKPEKQSAALYYFARAAAYDGPGSLTPEGRTQVKTYLEKAYTSYHGKVEGLDKLLAQAKTSAMPPANFEVVSVAKLAEDKAKQEEEERQKNPSLALWKTLKGELTSATGETYFNEKMKGAALPEFEGKLVSMEPAVKPKTLVLAIEDGKTPDATIKLDTPLPGKADPGTTIKFKGVPASYTASPFMVTFTAEKKDITGWPGKAEPAKKPVHRTAHRKR